MENKELKTLKDLKFINMRISIDKGIEKLYDGDDLKQEAIRWLRHFQSGDIKTDLQREGIIEFILNFFNITDEDLK